MTYLFDFKKVSAVAVHFVRPEDVNADLDSLGLAVMESSVAEVETDKELFAVVASAMQFPDYFGGNWDALDECLGDLDWLPADGYMLVLNDTERGWSKCPYVLGRFVTTWLESSEYWAGNQVPFHLVFVM